MFTEGFRKVAYDEQAEYEKANAVDRVLEKLPSPSQDKPLKVGARVAYYSDDRGWKRGPWASHTKGCSEDEKIDKQRESYKKKLKTEPPYDHPDHPYKKFPTHHEGDWNKHAVRIGDLGTVVGVKKGAQSEYRVVWDKHPKCYWGGYRDRELKLVPPEMASLTPAPDINLEEGGGEKTAARITPDIGNYGAPKGASGVTGRPVEAPFSRAVATFGRKPRMALKSFTRLRRGF